MKNNNKLTTDEKIILYTNHKYKFPPPSVCCAGWSDYDWIKYIDECGEWIK